jgi:hypothetical protein
MELNRRHKAILFITLVTTGCALLLDAELKEALGFMMLGAAFAWVIGSDSASKFYAGLKNVPATFYSWIRLPVAMALAGALLGAVLLYSHANPVFAVAFMCVAGIVISPLTSLPSKKVWLKVPLFLISVVIFFLTIAAMIETDLVASNKYAARSGQISVAAFAALIVGTFWLSRGWKLIGEGIAAQPENVILPALTARAWGQYASLLVGICILTSWLSLLAWFYTGSWAYAPEKVVSENPNDNHLIAQVGFIMLLAWWPYAAWKSILNREPNSERRYLHRHKRVTGFAGMFFVLALSLAITFGIQNGNDRLLTDRITDTAADLTRVAQKIGAIKQRNMKTTDDYIQAFAEIEALVPEYDLKVQQYHAIFQDAEQRDKGRGPINIQRFYKSHRPEVWQNDLDLINTLTEIGSLTRKETEVARQMAALPAQEQPDFWQREFRPLLVQEDQLRERAVSLGKKNASLTK